MSSSLSRMSGKIIGLSGKIGSGKNFLSEKKVFDKLHSMGKNVVIMAFGDILKMMCYAKDNISYEKLFYDKDQQTRKILQTRGMKEREIDNKIFVKMIECQMRIAFDRNIDIIIISDLRFRIEFDFLKEKGATLIRVNAPKRTYDKMFKECSGNKKAINEISEHISEIELDNCKDFDYYLNNDYEYEKKVSDEVCVIIEKITK